MSFLSRALSGQPEARAMARLVDIPPWAEVSTGMGHAPRNAMKMVVFFRCVDILAKTVASLPIAAYRETKKGRVEVNSKLMSSPYPGITWQNWLVMLMRSLAVTGNGFGYITSRDQLGNPTAILPLHPDSVRVDPANGSWWEPAYEVFGKPVTNSADVFHVKAYPEAGYPMGLSPIEHLASTLELGWAAEQYGLRWFKDSANPSGILTSDADLTEDQVNREMKRWIQAHGRGKRYPAIMGGGLTFKPIGIPPNESQFLECVVPGTLITMADGTRRAAETLRAGDMVQAWNGSKLEAAKVSAVGEPPIKPLVRIKTARGRELTATSDHPVLALRRLRTPGCRPLPSYDGEWISMGDLEPGNYVRVALGSLPGAEASMSDAEAYFLGAMVGDGYIRSGSPAWASSDTSVTARMSDIVASLGGELRYKDRYDYTVNTGPGTKREPSRIRTLLNESGLVGSHSHTKFVPDNVIKGGASAWRQFLSGYFDADGSIRERGGKQTPAAYWASTSRDLLEGAQHLLALLGIQSSIYPMHPGGAKDIAGRVCEVRPGWGLYVMGVGQLSLLAHELDLAHREKAQRLAEYLDNAESRYGAANFDYDRVVEVVELGAGETVGIEIEDLHTHVTGGIITHNTRAHQRSDIAMMFGIPPHMLGDTEKSTSWGTGIAEQVLGFQKFTINPWVVCIEQAFNLILPRGQFAKFNMDALLRPDLMTRYKAHQMAIQSGMASPDERRAIEDLAPIEGYPGNIYLQPANFVPLGYIPPEKPDPADKATLRRVHEDSP